MDLLLLTTSADWDAALCTFLDLLGVCLHGSIFHPSFFRARVFMGEV